MVFTAAGTPGQFGQGGGGKNCLQNRLQLSYTRVKHGEQALAIYPQGLAGHFRASADQGNWFRTLDGAPAFCIGRKRGEQGAGSLAHGRHQVRAAVYLAFVAQKSFTNRIAIGQSRSGQP